MMLESHFYQPAFVSIVLMIIPYIDVYYFIINHFPLILCFIYILGTLLNY